MCCLAWRDLTLTFLQNPSHRLPTEIFDQLIINSHVGLRKGFRVEKKGGKMSHFRSFFFVLTDASFCQEIPQVTHQPHYCLQKTHPEQFKDEQKAQFCLY